jgi:hypothetical protein
VAVFAVLVFVSSLAGAAVLLAVVFAVEVFLLSAPPDDLDVVVLLMRTSCSAWLTRADDNI